MADSIIYGRNMAVNSMTGYATKTGAPLSSENAIRISHRDDAEYTYVDQDFTSMPDAPTLVTLRSEQVNNVSRNPLKKLVYAKSAKGGRLISGKRELVIRRLIDGMYYDEPVKLILTCEISNGAIAELEQDAMAAKYLAQEIAKMPDLFIQNEYYTETDASGDKHTTFEYSMEGQPQLERMLYGNAEWVNVPEETE